MLLAFYLLSLAPTFVASASSTLTNGGFETGDLTGWTIGGSASRVEVLKSTNFSSNIEPPEGTFFALLATGPGAVNPISVSDLDGNGANNFDTSTLNQTFTLTERSVFSFQWCFLTEETARGTSFEDIFYVELNGSRILTGSVPGAAPPSQFPDVPTLDAISYVVSSSGVTNGNQFDGRTQFQNFSIVLDAGIYKLSILVADDGDNTLDSGLLIDSLKFSPPPPTLSDIMEKLEAIEDEVDAIEAKLDNETRFTDDTELSNLETKLTAALDAILEKLCLPPVGGFILPREELSYILYMISENLVAVTLIITAVIVYLLLAKRMS